MSTETSSLALGQEGIWVAEQLAPSESCQTISWIEKIPYYVDKDLLKQALHAIVNRHDILRTQYHYHNGNLTSKVVPKIYWDLSLITINGNSTTDSIDRIKEECFVELNRKFQLDSGPLFRFKLYQSSEDLFYLYISFHHIIFDAFSVYNFQQNLVKCYHLAKQKKLYELPLTKIQYQDYVCEERERLNQGAYNLSLRYWKKKLKNSNTLCDLPIDHSRPAQQKPETHLVDFSLRENTSQDLIKFSQRQGITPYTTLLTSFHVFIMRLSGQKDILIGSPFGARPDHKYSELIGFFVNTLPIRCDMSQLPNFKDLVQQVHKNVIEAMKFQYLPFKQLVKELTPNHPQNSSPLFQVVVRLLNNYDEGLRLRDPNRQEPASTITLDHPHSTYDLDLNITIKKAQISFTLMGKKSLFLKESIERFSRQYLELLNNILEQPDLPIHQLSLSDESEWSFIQHCSLGPQPTLHEPCVHRILESIAQKNPNDIAIIHSDTKWSYESLNHKSNQLARHLISTGVKNGDHIGLFFEHSFELVQAMLACMKAQAIFIPMNSKFPKSLLDYHIQDSGALYLLSTSNFSATLEHRKEKLILIDQINPSLEQQSSSNLNLPIAPQTPVSLMYTSGSTGAPRGSIILHQGISSLILSNPFIKLNSETKTFFMSSPAFDASTFEIWASLLHGGSCVISPKEALKLVDLQELIPTHHINTLWLTSALFNLIADSAFEALSNLDYLIIGGEVLSVTHVQRVQTKLPHLKIVNGYGPTETTTFATLYPIEKIEQSAPKSIPIGKPRQHTQVYILDDHGRPCPVGVTGELCITGLGVAKGYWNKPNITLDKFRSHTIDGEEKTYYHSGDQARLLDSGIFEYHGRNDEQVKIRGFRIELSEITEIIRQHPKVFDAVTIVREEDHQKKLVSGIVVKREYRLSIGDLRAFLKLRLPDYCIPSEFFSIKSIPKTPNGKVRYQVLLDHGFEPLKPQSLTVAPEDYLLNQLTLIWRQVLKRDDFYIHDEFFDLGGDSLQAMAILDSIEKEYQVQLPSSFVYDNPTVSKMSIALASGEHESSQREFNHTWAHGSQTPFIYLHGDINGGGLYCQKIGKCLEGIRDFHTLRPHQLEEQKDIKHIQEMTDTMLQQVLRLRPEGPILLGGYCNGGLIAFDLAQKLLSMGREVPLLILIDPSRLVYNETYQQLSKFPEIDTNLIDLEQKRRLQLIHYAQLCRDYQPQPYPGPIKLILPGDDEEVLEHQKKAWNQLSDQTELIVTPGNHQSMLNLAIDTIADSILKFTEPF